jgi:tritrans,polycis-undecaprenyl-diphosphate synthase [geranylgeranyl-diphosphate specific]
MLPNHIGIILDGNRRYAKELMKKPWEGHKIGLSKARDVLEWSCERGIKYITAYVLSLENLNSRPKRELALILRYFENEMADIIKDKNHVIHRNKINVRFIGRTHILPDSIQEKMQKVKEATKGYSNFTLNIAIAYGGQQEIVDAVKKILEEGLKGVLRPSDLNETIIKEHMYTNGQPYPDMIIRTGGEKRLSNFLPFQSVYSELIFTDVKWPAFSEKDFDDSLKEFDERKRRVGA